MWDRRRQPKCRRTADEAQGSCSNIRLCVRQHLSNTTLGPLLELSNTWIVPCVRLPHPCWDPTPVPHPPSSIAHFSDAPGSNVRNALCSNNDQRSLTLPTAALKQGFGAVFFMRANLLGCGKGLGAFRAQFVRGNAQICRCVLTLF